MPCAEARGDELREPRVVEADDRGHRARRARRPTPASAAALAHEPDGVGEVERAGGDERRVLAHRVPGGEGGLPGPRRRARRPALADGREVGDRGGEQRGLGVLGPVELLGGAVPGEPADGLAERGVGRGEDGGGGGRGGGERPAHADGLGALAGEHEGDLMHRAAA